MSYRAHFEYEDGSWTATSPDVPGAITWGRSLASAREHLREAIASIGSEGEGDTCEGDTSVEGLERAFWVMCNDGWMFDARSDQWWVFSARCPHGSWRGESSGMLGLYEAMLDAFMQARDEHEK